jgi:alkanesulfonate monooxygenase SsuD/methylene tetrahydromethanopterin reductase-like flavin-dependent oxidoreductase (luciferase family)
MRYAINVPPVGPPAKLIDLAVAAERSGWDGVFLWDHLHLVRAMQLEIVDPWVVLGAIASHTERVRIGPLITPLPRRRPWTVAKELATLDQLSGGRVIFGAGLGFPPDDEFGMFGEPTDERARADLLDEGLVVVEALLRGEPVRHDGVHFHVDAHFRPPSVQQPRPPVWLAATLGTQRPLRRAQRYDGVVPISPAGEPITPADLARFVEPAERRDGWEVVASLHWSHTPAEYADAGATWLIQSSWPDGDWYEPLLQAARNGPPE